MVSIALEANDQKNPEFLGVAIEQLDQFLLTQEQNNKIVAILKNVASENVVQAPLLITQVLNGETGAIVQANLIDAQVVPKAPMDYVCFTEIPTSEFAITYPCTFEFGGTIYSSGDACFKAQYKKNNEDVLMHVQRAKFGQNPELKAQLLATGSNYIVCQGHDLFFSNCMVGTGQNSLGKCLMRLRGEYGGAGIIEPPKCYQEEVQNQMKKCHFLTNELCQDAIQYLFNQCLSQGDLPRIGALSCVNSHYNQTAKKCWERFSLKQCCLPGLTILDLKTMGFKGVEPKINHFEVLKSFLRDCSSCRRQSRMHAPHNAGRPHP